MLQGAAKSVPIKKIIHYSGNALSSRLVYRHATQTDETKVSNKHNMVKNYNWQEADQLAI